MTVSGIDVVVMLFAAMLVAVAAVYARVCAIHAVRAERAAIDAAAAAERAASHRPVPRVYAERARHGAIVRPEQGAGWGR